MVDKELEINKEEKVLKLEELLVEGTNVEVPITFDYPTKNGVVPVSAIIKPISSLEWNNTLKKYSRNLTYFGIAILSIGLLSTSGEPIDKKLIENMPTGVVDDLLKQIEDLSGIKQDKEEQYALTKELMGF